MSPRRFPLVVLCGAVSLALLLLPFDPQIHAIYAQTVAFQHARWTMALNQRVITVLVFWIALNAVALPAMWGRAPAWTVIGFGLGGIFLFTPQVYYHYFVPVLPFAALLAGRTVALIRSWRPPAATAAILLPALLAAATVDWGGHSPVYVTAARLSEVAPIVQLLDTHSSGGESVLADRYEYAYLARRPALAHYFWNVGVLVDAAYLERRVNAARAVVLSSGASSGYPNGFVAYLNRRYVRLSRTTTSVWLVPGSALRRKRLRTAR